VGLNEGGPKGELETYAIRLCIAGDIEQAKIYLRRECYQYGLCVTISPTTFIFTGAEESGMEIGFVNYPRFPSDPKDIHGRAVDLALRLIRELNQKSALLVATDKTTFLHVDPPGARTT
jgi:hypothetical protein